MTDHSYDELRRLFEELSPLDAERRRTRLDETCVGRPELRAELESLLGHADGKTEDLMVGPADLTLDTGSGESIESDPTQDPAISDGISQVGRYQIVRRIGAGGMGVVYEARQDSPSRRVALKLLAPFSGPEAERRFELEGELLGRLQHPGIARVYDAGTAPTEHGNRAFLAMELVDGSDLLEHAHHLALRDRLELLAEIADAVEHAHQRGVIHRDLKPANVLVETSGRPIVLDFGIARALDADAEQVTQMTQAGMIVGTLSYMSPEQASGDPDQIDTRTDIYALGVIAYEVLSGVLPIELGSLSITAALEAVRQRTPSPLRDVMPGVPGDVATIVHCALQKDPDQRYRSAGALADDLRRFLQRRPITARPPSAVYELKQFVRRHRLPVSLFAVAIIGVTIGFFRARAAEKKAEQRRVAAESALADAEALSDFLANLVDEANPINVDGDELTFREALDQAAVTMEDQLGDRPMVLATTHRIFGQDYDIVGDLEAAEHHLRRSFEIRSETLGIGHPDTIRAVGLLGLMLVRDGVRHQAAIDLIAPLLSDITGQVDSHPHEVAIVLQVHGLALMYAGDLEGAERDMRRAVEAHAVEGRDHLAADVNAGMAAILRRAGHAVEAEPWIRRGIAVVARTHGEDSDQVAILRSNLAINLKAQGRLDEAESLLRSSLEVRRRYHGVGAINTLVTESNLGSVLFARKQYSEAEEVLRDCVERHRVAFGARHHNVGFPLFIHAQVLDALGRRDDAIALYQELYGLWSDTLGPTHRNLYRSVRAIADLLVSSDQIEEAEPWYRRALEIALGSGPSMGPNAEVARLGIAFCLADSGDIDEATQTVSESTAAFPDSATVQILGASVMSEISVASGDLKQAESALRKALDLNPQAPDLGPRIYVALSEVLKKQGRAEDAVSLLEPYVPMAESALGVEHREFIKLRSLLEELRDL